MLVAMAACSIDQPEPRLEEPYVAVHTHWQTGERAVYRSVEIYDGERLVISPEVPQAEWEQTFCAEPDPAKVLAMLDARGDLAETNLNLSARHGHFSEVATASLEDSLRDSLREGCEERDFSALTGDVTQPHL